MRLFALHETINFSTAVAASAGIELDPMEEREFADGEHKSRPLISVRGEDVYVVHALHGRPMRSPSDKLLRLLFFVATCRDNGAARRRERGPWRLAPACKDQLVFFTSIRRFAGCAFGFLGNVTRRTPLA